MKALKNLFTALILVLIGAVISYLPIKGYFQAKLEGLKPSEIEVIKTDTIRLCMPTEIEKRITDTVAVIVRDTLFRVDTLYLPREQKVYADSSYRAVVSGISPRLDSIEVYNKVITKIATQKEWRKFDYGIQAGVGLVNPINSPTSVGWYAGFGVTYHF